MTAPLPLGSVRPTRYVFERAPMLVYWEMTRACRLACRHCRAEAVLARSDRELTTAEGERLLDQVSEFGRPFPHVVFTGGDPLRRPDLVHLAREATARGIGTSVSPSATDDLTPGTIAELRSAGVASMSLSLDGSTAERHAFLALRPAALALCTELGLGDEVVPPLEPGGTFVWHNERLVPVPDGTGLGIPTRFMPFLASPLFTPLEKLRAAMEIALPADRSAGDVSIGAFLRGRFGDAAVDRLAGPIVSGIYGAAIDELSLDALMSRLRDAVLRHGSLVRAGLAASRGAGAPARPLLLTLRPGMGSLIDALAARLGGADLRLGADLLRIERAGARYAAHLGDGSRVDADAVVLATPAPATARSLEDLAPAAADALGTITYRGTAAVSLAYESRQLPGPLEGHGFVVPDGALPIVACTWTSAKWPGRAPEGSVLLRATIRSDALLAAGDDALVDAAHRALARAMRIEGRPVLAHVARWEGAMPRYTVGHLDRFVRIDAALRPFQGLVLAGAAYRGAGVADCVTQGQAAAIVAAEATVA